MLLCAPFPESEVAYLVTDLSRNKCRMADVTYKHPLMPFAHPNVIQHDTIQHKYNIQHPTAHHASRTQEWDKYINKRSLWVIARGTDVVLDGVGEEAGSAGRESEVWVGAGLERG